MNRVIELLKNDPLRMQLLKAVALLNLPDCYIAAGFVRNLIWDHLHGLRSTALNDIDIIYFSKEKLNENSVLDRLYAVYPNIRWQVKNQAYMHEKNGDLPYKSSAHAMSFWPEIETAIGVRLEVDQQITVIAPFGLESNFNGFITHNVKREKAIFLDRVEKKQWLKMWPKLQIRS